jgi:DNA-binding NtrC family response regulator
MPTVYKTVDIDIDVNDILEEVDTENLIEELERRGIDYNTKDVDADEMRSTLESIWMKRRTGQDYQRELDTLIYGVLGKVI